VNECNRIRSARKSLVQSCKPGKVKQLEASQQVEY
jgi:hypothetical protein